MIKMPRGVNGNGDAVSHSSRSGDMKEHRNLWSRIRHRPHEKWYLKFLFSQLSELSDLSVELVCMDNVVSHRRRDDKRHTKQTVDGHKDAQNNERRRN